MFDTIFGLPMHALVIHAVVVFLPLASVSVLAAAFWPKFRRWAGPLPLIVSVLATIMVPVATQSGEAFQARLNAGENAAVNQHAALGNLMIWWSIGLVIAAAAVYWLHMQAKKASVSGTTARPSQGLVIAIMVLAAVASVGTLVHVARVGDAGARAAWAFTVPAG